MPHAVKPGSKTTAFRPILLLLALVAVLAAAGCADEKSTKPLAGGDACRTCHTSKVALIASAAPVEEPGEDPGEG